MAKSLKTVDRFETTLASSIDDTVDSIELSSVTGLDTDGGTVTIDWKNSDNEKTPTLLEEVAYTGISGTTLTGCTRGISGTAQAHSAGAKVVQLWSSYPWNQHIDAFEAEHDDAGTHSDITADTVTVTGDIETSAGAVITDTITEETSDTGVTIDGLLVKDGTMTLTDTAPVMNVKARAYKTSTQAVGNGTKITWDAESYDIGSDFDLGNERFVAPVTGYYLCICKVDYTNANLEVDKTITLTLRVNGTVVASSSYNIADVSLGFTLKTIDIVYMTASQYIEAYNSKDTTSNPTVNGEATGVSSYFDIHLLSI